jgi:hypothetical protein
MSQRFGMADGRCFTIGTSSRLLNDYVMSSNQIQYQDNYSYRQLLQTQGPDLLTGIQNTQQPQPGSANQCMECNNPLLKVPNIY